MAYADLAAAKTAAAALQVAIDALQTAASGAAELQKAQLMGPEQRLLSKDEIDEVFADVIEAVDAFYALFP